MDSFRALCSQWWIVVGPVRNCCWDIWNTLIIFFGNVDWGKQNMARTLHFFEVKPGHLTLPSWQCCLILKPTSIVLQRCQTGISVLKCSGLLCALPPNHPQQIVAIVTLSSLVLYFNLKTKQSSWISLHHTETYYIYSLEPWWLAFLYNTFTPKNSLLILMHHHCSTEHSSEDLLGLDVKLREIQQICNQGGMIYPHVSLHYTILQKTIHPILPVLPIWPCSLNLAAKRFAANECRYFFC